MINSSVNSHKDELFQWELFPFNLYLGCFQSDELGTRKKLKCFVWGYRERRVRMCALSLVLVPTPALVERLVRMCALSLILVPTPALVLIPLDILSNADVNPNSQEHHIQAV